MNKSLRKLFSLALALALVFSSGLGVGNITAQAEETTNTEFTDIANLTDAEKANIEFVVDRGIIKGHVDNTFRPNDSLTRRHAAMILAEELGLELLPYKGTFSDVTEARNGQAIEALVRAKIVSGYPDGTFEPEAPLQRVHFAKLVANAYNLEMGEKAVTLTDLEALGTDKTFVELVVSNGIVDGYPNGTFGGRNEVKRIHVAKFMTNTIEFVEAQELEVVSVSAINAKTIKVEFNMAVEEEATFEVKKGTSTVAVEATWADDKKSVELARTVNFAAGDYTVKVNELEAVALKIEAQKVTSIEILGSDLIKNPGGTAATFNYVVKDQYGTDITKSVPQSAFTRNAIVGSTAESIALTPSTGTATISHTFATTDKTALITLVHNTTAVNVTATLDVAAAATVEALEFGAQTLPTGKTRIETGSATAATIAIEAFDQYGNQILSHTALDAALMEVISDPNVTLTWATVSNKPVVQVNTSGLTLPSNVNAKPVVLTLVNSTTGKTYSITIEVNKPAGAHGIEIGEFNKEVIAAGDTVYAPITVTNQFGDQLTPAQVVANAATITGWFSGESKISSITIESNRDSANYGKLKVVAGATAGTDVLVIAQPAGLYTKTVEVKAARIVTEVRNLAAVTMLQGSTYDVEFDMYDQYQALISSVGVGNTNTNLTYEVTLTKVSGDTGAVTTGFTLTGTDEEDLVIIPVSAAADKTGTYKLTVNLLDGALTVVSSASINITVAKNNDASLIYSVKEVPVLAGNVDYSVGSAYASKVVVEATDAAGTKYVINPADIVNVVSNNTAVANVGKVSSNWYVFGKAVTAEKTAEITVFINTLDGIKTVTTTATVSNIAPQVKEVRTINASLGAATRTAPSASANKSVYEFATEADAVTGQNIYVVGLDQYGVWNDISDSNLTVIANTTNHSAYNAFSITGTTLKKVISTVTVGQDILVTITSGTGAKQITVKILN